MTSDLITYLMEERFTEQERAHAAQLEQERAAWEQERAEAQMAVAVLAGTVEDTVIARFPNTPSCCLLACDNSAMSNGYKHSMLWCWGRRTRQAWSGSYKRRDAD